MYMNIHSILHLHAYNNALACVKEYFLTHAWELYELYTNSQQKKKKRVDRQDIKKKFFSFLDEEREIFDLFFNRFIAIFEIDKNHKDAIVSVHVEGENVVFSTDTGETYTAGAKMNIICLIEFKAFILKKSQ